MIALILANWRAVSLAAGLLLVGWYIQHVKVVEYRRGAEDGKQSALKDAAAKIEADSRQRKAELDQREMDLSAMAAQIQGERAAVNAARSGLNAALSASLNQIATRGADIQHEVQAVPDSAVNARFRIALDRARAAELERAAQH